MGNNTSTSSQWLENDVLQKSVTNSMVSSTNAASNTVSIMQNINITFDGDVSCPIKAINSASVDILYVTSIDQQTAINMQTALTADLNSTASQSVKIIRQMLSNIGTSNNDSTTNTVISRVKQIIEKNVTVKSVNTILNGTLTIQNQNLHFGGKTTCPPGGTLEFTNDLQFKLVAQSVIKNLVDLATSDAAIARIVTVAKQDVTIKAEGLAGVISALTGPIIYVIIAGIAAFTIVGKQGLKSITDPKFAVVASVAGVGYLVLAYFLKLMPFRVKKPGAPAPSKSPTPWVCQKYVAPSPSAGLYTGACVKWTETTAPPAGVMTYDTQSECENSGSCPMYWGCATDPTTLKFNGSCVQKTNALDGPYATHNDCDSAVANNKACRYYWGCGDGVQYTDTKTCYEYQNISDGPSLTKAACASTCAA